jgi:hypothetical protein
LEKGERRRGKGKGKGKGTGAVKYLKIISAVNGFFIISPIEFRQPSRGPEFRLRRVSKGHGGGLEVWRPGGMEAWREAWVTEGAWKEAWKEDGRSLGGQEGGIGTSPESPEIPESDFFFACSNGFKVLVIIGSEFFITCVRDLKILSSGFAPRREAGRKFGRRLGGERKEVDPIPQHHTSDDNRQSTFCNLSSNYFR